jgi:putative SOS response-associated peptidase YedK
MCGRSTLHDTPTNILERFSLPPMLPGFVPRYNIAPTQLQWAISREKNGDAVVRQLRWGLVPSWATDPAIGNRMINARADALTTKPSWRDSLRTQRCVILADGYYEWKTAGKQKTPMYFRLADGRSFGLAGLWDRWQGGETPLDTCTVITTKAGPKTSPCHHRMPVMLTEDASVEWLEPSARERDLLSLLTVYEGDDLDIYEVSRHVNNTANDDPECIRRVIDAPTNGAGGGELEGLEGFL